MDEFMPKLNTIITIKKKRYCIEELEHSSTPEPNIVPFVPVEARHFFLDLQNPVVEPMHLQADMRTQNDCVRMIWFISPPIIQIETLPKFLKFANEANHQLHRGCALGRFWVDAERLDFAYELLAPELVLTDIMVMGTQLFNIPISHFTDAHIPLMKLADGDWGATKAIRYLRELREKGVVDNRDYGLL